MVLGDTNNTSQTIWLISDLAKEFGITPRTLRYYEDQGIVAPTRDGQRRLYSQRDRSRLKLALRGKRLGLTLNNIRQLINLYDGPSSYPGQLASYLAVLRQQKAFLLRKRSDLNSVLREIYRHERYCLDLLSGAAIAQSTPLPSLATPPTLT